MPKHDLFVINDNWMYNRKSLTEEELNEDFKKSKFKSHQAFLAWSAGADECLESRFWEWLESTPIKYDMNGDVKCSDIPLLVGLTRAFFIVIAMFGLLWIII